MSFLTVDCWNQVDLQVDLYCSVQSQPRPVVTCSWGVWSGLQEVRGHEVNPTHSMLIHIKAVCLPAGVGALGDITTQLQFDDVHSRKKNIYSKFFFFFLKVPRGREDDDVTVCHQTGLYTQFK